jgi:NADH dehydrogenase
VGEVAGSYRRAVDDASTVGEIYELGGGEIYSYEEMLDLIADHLGKSKPKVHMPVPLMKAVVAISSPLPTALRPPVTKEQLNMLALDNCTDNSRTAELIGREPTSLRDGLDYIAVSG